MDENKLYCYICDGDNYVKSKSFIAVLCNHCDRRIKISFKMMDRRNKPVVINLAEDLKRKSNGANFSRNRIEGHSIKDDKLQSLEQSSPRNGKNLLSTSDLDAELKNDFRWLINFNLKDILGCDIDEEYCNLERKSEKRKRSLSKENTDKQDYRFPLTDIVKKCLLEKDGITVREIFEWIRSRYPSFKTKDCKWKNFVRRMLIKNPLFKNRKSKQGRNDLWYLDRNYPKGLNLNVEQNMLLETESNLMKSLMSEQPETNEDFPLGESENDKNCYSFNGNASYRAAIDDVQTNAVQVYPAENWIETTEHQDKGYIQPAKEEEPPQYYEMQTALRTEFLVEHAVPLETIHFFDENISSISVELV